MINYDNLPSVETTQINQAVYVFKCGKGWHKSYKLDYCIDQEGRIYLSLEHLIAMFYGLEPKPRSESNKAASIVKANVSPCFSLREVSANYYIGFHNQALADGAKVIRIKSAPFALGLPLSSLDHFLNAIEPRINALKDVDTKSDTIKRKNASVLRRFNFFKYKLSHNLIDMTPTQCETQNKAPYQTKYLLHPDVIGENCNYVPRSYTGRIYNVRHNPRFAEAYYNWL